MNEPNSDEDLAGLFARQRDADGKRAPSFHAMRTRALGASAAESSPVNGVWRWAVPVGAAGVLALGVGLMTHRTTPAPVAKQPDVVRELAQIDTALQKSLAEQNSLTAWQSPTDFLLKSIPSKLP